MRYRMTTCNTTKFEICALYHSAPARPADSVGHCTDVEKGNIEGRYSKDYEDAVNPFSNWRDREKAARRSKLSMIDRLSYEVGQLVASSV